ncbi:MULTISPECIES: nucleoside-diphosphate kinase [Candidatus Nitrosocaldus]|jgi:nucleoside-diphosphate kinase|uniref:Nucleoside diphosphate kinase n=1 Tax=Candidatus Nitrosocaldus cavascurensis TaxID=2058097 RepID=A0A2K5AQ24_9ARCH|nr:MULTISPECIES: nucleoside-diphosphate kinase [Candidatus Nitrosocaldus]GBC74080.1 Nucleoside diphosphate kinase [archaeon HR05]SPC33751.1 Nucleoside diphosphate kinase [Candidatus Nitrosocaldus cavascurensis]
MQAGSKSDKTLIVIKPDAVRKNVIGSILKRFEDEGFRIRELRMLRLSKEDAEEFYSVHRDKPFFNELVQFITSGSVVAAILEDESSRGGDDGDMDAIAKVRKIIGATNPSKAEEGTIRRLYGSSITENAIHASDSIESFEREAKVIFNDRK